MEIIQWISALGSMLLLSYLVVGIALPLLLFFAISRPLGIIVGSIAMGLATLAHMLMAPVQRAIGVPKAIQDSSFIQGVSFGDLIAGNVPSFEICVALCGMLSALGGGLYVVGRFSHLISQIENIPTSTARSAAIGLAEFKGVIRPAPGALPDEIEWELFRIRKEDILEGGNVEIPEQYLLVDGTEAVTIRRGRTTISDSLPLTKWSAFYLEDATGRILIDPRRVLFGGLIFTPFIMGSAQVLNLTKNWEATQQGARSFLKPGDRVYVIGTVQVNERAPIHAVDAERLVVRPRILQDRGNWSFLSSPFFSGTLNDVFIVSDDREMNLAATLRRSRKWACQTALLLAVIATLSFGNYLPELSFSTISVGPGKAAVSASGTNHPKAHTAVPLSLRSGVAPLLYLDFSNELNNTGSLALQPGTGNGPIVFGQGIEGTAGHFDDNVVRFGLKDQPVSSVTSFTIEFWFKFDDNVQWKMNRPQVLLGTNGFHLVLAMKGNTFTLKTPDQHILLRSALGADIAPSQWYHFLMARDEPTGSMHVFVNGELVVVEELRLSGPIISVGIGGENFQGWIDEFYYYDHARAPEKMW